MSDKQQWPAWYYGPNGKAEIFEDAKSVPSGWQDHPSKVGKTEKPAQAQKVSVSAPASSDEDLDAHGWPWTAELHAASKSKTSAGLWRMKVGASRPAPKAGYPIGASEPAPLDL